MKKNDLALLILRIGIGGMFILHGYPKIMGGSEKWIGLGKYGMGSLGIYFLPKFWGFMAAFSEFIGGAMVALGLYTRLFSFLLFITMVVASIAHINNGDGIMGASHAIEAGIVFLFLFIYGPGNIIINRNDINNEEI